MSDATSTVLIADDESDVIELIKVALEDDGYQIVATQDGEAALAAARVQSPDIVILDVQMPKKTGFEVFRELRSDEATKDIPVIMLTGINAQGGLTYSGEDMGEFYGSDPEAFIDKPIDPVVLSATVRSLLNARA
ncbi:response regulator [bacterium]|nr:response regulator [bacterium]